MPALCACSEVRRLVINKRKWLATSWLCVHVMKSELVINKRKNSLLPTRRPRQWFSCTLLRQVLSFLSLFSFLPSIPHSFTRLLTLSVCLSYSLTQSLTLLSLSPLLGNDLCLEWVSASLSLSGTAWEPAACGVGCSHVRWRNKRSVSINGGLSGVTNRAIGTLIAYWRLLKCSYLICRLMD